MKHLNLIASKEVAIKELPETLQKQLAKWDADNEAVATIESESLKARTTESLTDRSEELADKIELYLDKKEKENEKKEALKQRAKAAGISEDATEQEIEKQEEKNRLLQENLKSELKRRAVAISLPEDANQAQIEAKEAEIEAAKLEAEKLQNVKNVKKDEKSENPKKPSERELQIEKVIESIYAKGLREITDEQLTKAGVGTWSEINVGTTQFGKYKLTEKQFMGNTYTIEKLKQQEPA